MTSTLEWLECSRCHVAHETAKPLALCRCGGVLLARYRLEEAARTMTRETIASRAPSMWRYAEVLPGIRRSGHARRGDDPAPPAPVHRTVARRGQIPSEGRSAESHGFVQSPRNGDGRDDGNGTQGLKRIALPSAGNAGSAAAAYGAAAGLAVQLFLPDQTPDPFRLEAVALGATVHLVRGDISTCGRVMREREDAWEWFDLSTLREPYRLEGKKTLGYELAEQLGLDASRRDRLPHRRRHRPDRHVEGVRGDGAARADRRRKAASHGLGASRRVRADRRGVRARCGASDGLARPADLRGGAVRSVAAGGCA